MKLRRCHRHVPLRSAATRASVAALVAVASTSAAIAAQDLPAAEAVLAEVEAKLGDAARRAAVRSLLASGKVGGAGVGGGKFVERYLGDRASYRVEFGPMEMVQGTDGDMCWSTDPAVGITVRKGAAAGPVRRMFAIGRRAPWRTMYASAKTVAEVELDGRPHLELHMKPRDGGDAEKWFVDPEADVVTRVDLSLPDPLGGQIACQYWFTDWREVDGLLYPFEKTQKVGTYEIAYEYTSIEPNAEIDAAAVAPSAKVLAAAKKQATAKRVPAKKGAFGVERAPRQHTATIRLEIDSDAVGKTLAVVLPEVMVHLRKAGVSPSGPPFARYHSIDGGKIDLEAGMPVAEAVTGAGRVGASTLPAGQVAVTWHFGPFDGLPKTHDALKQWIEKRELAPQGGYWEVYWTDPGIEPDPSKWRTQLVWPVADATEKR